MAGRNFVNRILRMATAVGAVVAVTAGVLALSAPPASAFFYANEGLLACEDFNRQSLTYDPGQCQVMGHDTFLDLAGSYAADPRAGFDRNFLAWAPITTMTPAEFAPYRWSFCNSFHPTHTYCSTPGVFSAVEIGSDLTVKKWGDGWISVVCGNYSQTGTRNGPTPSITGLKYEDRNRNHQRDGGEPGLGGWTMQLYFNGSFVTSTTTAANGTYAFSLNANVFHQIRGGTYQVVEVAQPGWAQVQAPGAIGVSLGVGNHVFDGNDFGNYRLPNLSISDQTVIEGTGGVNSASFTVALDQPTGKAVTVVAATTPGTATAGADYTPVNTTVTIPANAGSTTVTVPITTDAVDEHDESFTVNLSSPSDGAVTDASGAATILDDDTATLSVSDASVVEGDPGDDVVLRYEASLSTPADRTLTFPYTTSPGTAIADGDYEEQSGALSFPAGTTTQNVDVRIIEDLIDELDEITGLTFGLPSDGAVADGGAAGTILDDDTAEITIGDATSVEGDPGDDVTLVHAVTLSTRADRDVHVQYQLTSATATAGVDVAPIAGQLTIPAMATTGTIEVPMLEDLVDELDETYTLNLTGTDVGTLVDAEATGTVLDDDTSMITIADDTVIEGDPGDDVRLVHAVGLSTPADRDIHLPYLLSDGTAAAGLDVEPTAGTLTIPAGATTGPIEVGVLEDVLDELDESYTLAVTATDVGELADPVATGTVLDDDTARVVLLSDTVVEGNPGDDIVLSHRVLLSTPSDRTVTVDYATTPGSATADGDYATTTGTATFAPLQTDTTIDVAVVEDLAVEPDEAYTLTLSAFVNTEPASPTAATALGHILDDDWRQGTLSCRAQGVRLLGSDLYVANAADHPCKPQLTRLANITVGNPVTGLLRATAVSAQTTQNFTLPGAVAPADGDQATAVAQLAGIRLTVGLLLDLRADVVDANAVVTCSGGVPRFRATSRVAGLRVAGQAINTSAPVTINIAGLGTLRLNSVVTSRDRVTARAIWLDLPGTALDIVVSEATADIHDAPCRQGRPPATVP